MDFENSAYYTLFPESSQRPSGSRVLNLWSCMPLRMYVGGALDPLEVGVEHACIDRITMYYNFRRAYRPSKY